MRRYRLPIILIAAYTLYCALVTAFQDRLLYPYAFDDSPSGLLSEAVLASSDGQFERVWLDAPDGARVEGWFFPVEGSSAANPAAAVLYLHGNMELIDECRDVAAGYRKLGLSVLLCEIRGFGRSTGRPTQPAIISDLVRFHDWLAARNDVDSARIVLHGRSLGGAAVVFLAQQRKPAAVVLTAPLPSVPRICVRSLFVPGWFCRDRWEADAILPTLGVPTLILHGRDDSMVPISESLRLKRLTPGCELVELSGGHNDFPREAAPYWKAIQHFLSRHQLASE